MKSPNAQEPASRRIKLRTLNQPIRLMILFALVLFACHRLFAQTTAMLGYSGTIQTWTVPAGVTTVTILAKGAQGGGYFSGSGGNGASIQGTFAVNPGDVLRILVGQMGASAYGWNGGGGGGTFVWNQTTGNTLYIAAGGGGGLGYLASNGGHGSATQTPTAGFGAGSGAGGSGGNGGSGGAGFYGNPTWPGTGGGGAGWLNNGALGIYPPAGGGGVSPLNGGAGGPPGNIPNNSYGSYGGFGGGGGSAGNGGAGGGGGGYNGGGGGNIWNFNSWGSGGGGSSFNNGSSPANIAGANFGHGSVALTWPSPEIVVEQPLGNNIPDGGNKSFGGISVGANTSLTFTIKNTGNANLTGLSITIDGSHAAMFSVTANPTAPVSPGGSTTFTVQFAPSSVGSKTAVLHITHNDTDENPFDITLTGTAVNTPPSLANAIPDQPGQYGMPFAFTFAANTFNDPDAAQLLTYTATGMPAGVLFDGLTRTFSGTLTVVGTFPIIVVATDNATPSASAQDTFDLVIDPAPLSVIAANASRTYGQANPAFTGTLTGMVLGDNITATYATAAAPLSNAGNYPILPSLHDPDGKLVNYSVTANDGSLIVYPAPATVTANAKSKTYGDANSPLDATVTGQIPGGDVINYALDTAAVQFSGVGSYPILVTLGSNPNYSVTPSDGTLAVNPALATVTANAKSKTYGAANPTLNATVTGQVVGGAPVNYTLGTTATLLSSVGGYPIAVTLGGNPNYTVTKTDATLTVNSALLVVTADNQSRVFGEADPTFTGSISGLQNGDSFPVSISCAAMAASLVGTYPIVPSVQDQDGKLGNYTVSLVNGTLSITPRTLVVTIHDPAAGFLQTNNTAISFAGSFTPTGNAGAYSAHWTVSSATVAETAIPATVDGVNVSAQIQFPTPGVYLITLTVEDAAGTVGAADLVEQDLLAYVVIYDPNGGFVTGGGWINSPAGAFHPDLEEFAGLTGRANFGFVSKYEKGANVPTGNTEFQFKAGGLNFKSTVYQWLVVSGPKAQYKGSGTINGSGDYGFLLTATDGQVSGGGGVDQFRIKIWEKISGAFVYDNVPGASEDLDVANPQAIGGGSISIKAK